MWIGYRKEIQKLTFRILALRWIRSDKELTPNYLVILLPLTQHHSLETYHLSSQSCKYFISTIYHLLYVNCIFKCILFFSNTSAKLMFVRVKIKIELNELSTGTSLEIQKWSGRLAPGLLLLLFRASDILHVAEPRISSKSAKSFEIHKKMRNPAKFARNVTKYMSAQHIWKLS